jgi:hypothetical protein
MKRQPTERTRADPFETVRDVGLALPDVEIDEMRPCRRRHRERDVAIARIFLIALLSTVAPGEVDKFRTFAESCAGRERFHPS